MPLFGKKKEELPPEAGGLVSQVLAMKAQGMDNNMIANQLRAMGYNLTQIRDAINQAEIKSAVSPGTEELPPLEGPELPPLEMPELPPLPPLPGAPQAQAPAPAPMPSAPVPPPQAPMPPPPAPIPGASVVNEQLVDELQRIIEGIIEEKWKGVDEKMASLEAWKAKLEEKINGLSEKTNSLALRIDDLTKGSLAKEEEYQKTMSDVNAQMQAIERIMGKIVPSLAEEIKELRAVVEELKER